MHNSLVEPGASVRPPAREQKLCMDSGKAVSNFRAQPQRRARRQRFVLFIGLLPTMFSQCFALLFHHAQTVDNSLVRVFCTLSTRPITTMTI